MASKKQTVTLDKSILDKCSLELTKALKKAGKGGWDLTFKGRGGTGNSFMINVDSFNSTATVPANEFVSAAQRAGHKVNPNFLTSKP